MRQVRRKQGVDPSRGPDHGLGLHQTGPNGPEKAPTEVNRQGPRSTLLHLQTERKDTLYDDVEHQMRRPEVDEHVRDETVDLPSHAGLETKHPRRLLIRQEKNQDLKPKRF